MKNVKIKIIVLILFLNPFLIYSQQLTIKEIQIDSLKRTRYNTLLKIIEVEKGSRVDNDIVDGVRQKLLSSGIFQNDIEVTLEQISDNEGILKIALKERWTLIPIPVGFVSSDSWLAGGVFIESNLLGLNQVLVAGTFASDENIQGFSAWSNPTFLKSDYSFGLSTSFYSGLNEYLDISGDNLASYNEDRLLLSLNVGRKYNRGFGWNIATGVEWLSIEDSKGYLLNSDFQELILKNVLSMSWDNLYYKAFFNEGWSTNLKSTFYTITDEYFKPTIEFKISKSLILMEKNLLKFSINSGWQDSIEYKPIFIGGTEGSRVLPSGDVAVNIYSDGLISFEPVIINPTWGIFTLPIYFEAGLFEYINSDFDYYYGPGIGFRFYVDKLSIPALGADFTWDFNKNNFKVAVSIGGTGGGD